MNQCPNCDELMQTINYCGICRDHHFRWIPVTERLPELGEEVLVCLLGSSLPEVAWLNVYDGEWTAYSTVLGDVTHWMPLPPLPGEEDLK